MLKNRIVLYALLLVFTLLAAACNPDDGGSGDPSYSLSVFIEGEGYVGSDSTIDCGPVCEDSYTGNPVIKLTAIADEGWVFDGWSGETCAEGVNSADCSLTIDKARAVTATFTEEGDGPGPGPEPVTVVIPLGPCETNNVCNDIEEITTGEDDGKVFITSSDLELNFEGEDRNVGQLVAVRFVPSLTDIPEGAVISSAYIQFTAEESSDEAAPTLTIKAETSENPEEFTGGSEEEVSSRSKTEDGVTWQPAAWLEDDKGEATQTPDLVSLLTEVEWQPGNAVVFFFEGDGTEASRSAYSGDSEDGVNPNAPEFVVTYTLPSDS